MSRVSIIKNKDGTFSVERTLMDISGGGVGVRLIKHPELKKGVKVRITQSKDGKKFKGEIVEDDE